jgi:hypothetical protein
MRFWSPFCHWNRILSFYGLQQRNVIKEAVQCETKIDCCRRYCYRRTVFNATRHTKLPQVMWQVGCRQARGQWCARVCSVPTTYLDTPISNFLSIKGKHADQPSKKRVTPYRIQIFYLLNHRGWKKTHFRECVSIQERCVQCYWSHCVFKVLALSS